MILDQNGNPILSESEKKKAETLEEMNGVMIKAFAPLVAKQLASNPLAEQLNRNAFRSHWEKP